MTPCPASAMPVVEWIRREVHVRGYCICCGPHLNDAAESECADKCGHRVDPRCLAIQEAPPIAAVSDLLDLAEAFVTAYKDNRFRTQVEEHLYQGARAAIAKAKGEL